jgi:hypothetical protein
MIHELLVEIENSISAKLFRVALFTALTIPDIAGALDSANGRATRERYVLWFDTYVAPKYFAFGHQYLTGLDCYHYRCVLLHQGLSLHPESRYSGSIFLFAKQDNIAYCGAFAFDDGRSLAIDIPVFCRNIVRAAWVWLDKVEDTERFKANSAEFLELRTYARRIWMVGALSCCRK